MAANTFDSEIRKFLPLLGNEEKKSLLSIIKSFLSREQNKKNDDQNHKTSSIDYTKYNFPVSDIKFNRDEINER